MTFAEADEVGQSALNSHKLGGDDFGIEYMPQAFGYLLAVLGKLFGTLSYIFMKIANH